MAGDGAGSVRGKVAVVGIGETTYYKRGESPDPEFKLGLEAIIAAAVDAGIDVREIDGFASYSNDRSDPSRIATALGLPELKFSRHGLGRRRWRRLGRGRQRRGGDRRRLRELRRRVSRAGAGPVRALRARGGRRPWSVARARSLRRTG